ncbi:hypothetical protein Patl1_21796 [Pistacia atlantica]|uniref:Uncharacterized protein n=1 Tax=Pistacia atlantica TaxID=434234 RepID=A0ACC1BIN9_9ROSI|nr:hypothetical protein Patl1_21796 [Pistacia atlantica]
MAQFVYWKQLTRSDVKYKLTVATGSLDQFFPSIPEGQTSQIFRVLDEECNTEWNFKLAVRKNGPLKPTVGGQWIKFCKMRGFQEGQGIIFFKERNEATGQIKYKIRPFYNFFST